MAPISPNRYLLLAFLLTAGFTFVSLHSILTGGSLSIPYLSGEAVPDWIEASEHRIISSEIDVNVARRIAGMRAVCAAENDFERVHGRTNLRLGRAYEGSHFRVQQFLHRALRGEAVTVSVVGGSVTKGHGVRPDETWFAISTDWLRVFVGDSVNITSVNGAIPAVGSDYFSYCHPLHLPSNSDLVFVELAVSDDGAPEHGLDMENLLRGILDMDRNPAVISVEAIAFSNGGMGGGGGRIHLPVAQYYADKEDVPVINQRHPVASHFGRYPELVAPYFYRRPDGEAGTRHIKARGHYDLGMLVAAFVQDVACTMLADSNFTVPDKPSDSSIYSSLMPPHIDTEDVSGMDQEELLAVSADIDAELLLEQETWPERARSWRLDASDDDPAGRSIPGFFTSPPELGILPRQTVLDIWNPSLNAVVPRFRPTCLSTRSEIPAFKLTPIDTVGWSYWTHPDFSDKSYIRATIPGSWVKFELDTSLGIVKVYSLKSKTFGLGNAECWIGEDRDKSVIVESWWESANNIGSFTTIRENLPAGRHTLTCMVSHKTSDPGGGTEFRLISVMSL